MAGCKRLWRAVDGNGSSDIREIGRAPEDACLALLVSTAMRCHAPEPLIRALPFRCTPETENDKFHNLQDLEHSTVEKTDSIPGR